MNKTEAFNRMVECLKQYDPYTHQIDSYEQECSAEKRNDKLRAEYCQLARDYFNVTPFYFPTQPQDLAQCAEVVTQNIQYSRIYDFLTGRIENRKDASQSAKFVDKRTGFEYLIYTAGPAAFDNWCIYEATKNDINLIVGDTTFCNIVSVVTKILTVNK